MTAATRRVIIIGGAYAGIAIAQQLDIEFRHPNYVNITLITPSTSFNMNHANLRGLVDEYFASKCFIPYDNLFLAKSNREIVYGKVSQVFKNHVVLEDGTELPFDYLAIASGSSYPSPLKFDDESKEEAIQVLNKIRAALKQAKRVLVVGAGSMGV